MAKKLISLSNDYIIEGKFKENRTPIDGGSSLPDYIDDTKILCNGKVVTETVYFHKPIYGIDGYGTGNYLKIELTVTDIKALYKEIEEIESKKVIGEVYDDLPF